MKRLLIILSTMLLIFSIPAWADEVDVSLEVDRNSLFPGEVLNVTINIDNGDGEVDISAIEDFHAFSTSSGSTMRIVGGRSVVRRQYSYTFVPRGAGLLKIPPLPVRVGGRIYRTKPMMIRVEKMDDLPSSTGDAAVRGTFSRKKVYVGQPLVYTFSFYHMTEVSKVKFQEPKFDDFTHRRMEERHHVAMVRNRRMNVMELPILLTPVDPGSYTIGPAILQCDILRAGDKKSSSRHIVLRSKPLSLDVLPLPALGDEETYSGLIGKFDIDAVVDKTSISTGDPLNLSITISGYGNLMDLTSPEVGLPDNFRIYEDAPEDDVSFGPDGYYGRRTFRYAIVSTEPGQFSLPEVKIVYFDPARGEYVTAGTPPFRISVNEKVREDGRGVTGNGYFRGKRKPATLKAPVRLEGMDILPLKERRVLVDQSLLPIRGYVFFLIFPVLLYIFLRAGLAWRSREMNDPGRIMRRKAHAALKRAASEKDSGLFLTDLRSAVVFAVFAVSGREGQTIAYTEVADLLGRSGMPGVSEEVEELLRYIDRMRYGGDSLYSSARECLLEDTNNLIKELCR